MTKRSYQVDLFRIIATLFVVLLHVLGQGGILANADQTGTLYWCACFCDLTGACAVNCFALISGYVMLDKTVKTKNVIRLWLQVLFTSLLISILFFVFIPETRTLRNLVIACFPVLGKQWWYISAYFVLFFFIPFLNTTIKHITQDALKIFLLTILFLVCFLDCIIPEDPFALQLGYSPVWLAIMYLFGAYIRKYNISEKTTALKSLAGFTAMSMLTFLSKFVIHFVTKRIFGEAMQDDIFTWYTSITVVLASIYLFLFCLHVPIGKIGEKIIAFFAPSTLGVYLIHVHPLVFWFVLRDAFVSLAWTSTVGMLFGMAGATLSIFVLCSMFDLLRIQFFRLTKADTLCDFISTKISAVITKIQVFQTL